MNAFRLASSSVLALALLCGLRAEEKKPDNKTLLVGVWELTKSSEGGPPVGTTMEFTKEGKVKMSGKADGKDFVFEGTYTVEGETLHLVIKADVNKEEKIAATIKKLTDQELVFDSQAGKTLAFKRKK